MSAVWLAAVLSAFSWAASGRGRGAPPRLPVSSIVRPNAPHLNAQGLRLPKGLLQAGPPGLPLSPIQAAPQGGRPTLLGALRGVQSVLKGSSVVSALGSVFDGIVGARRDAPLAEPVDVARPPAEQLAASAWYRAPAGRSRWSEARQKPWLRFYERLYRGLDTMPDDPGFGSRRADGRSVFYLGGHDIVQLILGLPRSVEGTEVNLYAAEGRPLIDYWRELELPGGGAVEVNHESTYSLQRMVARRLSRGTSSDALDDVQNNVFLKWNLAALTPEGVELFALDAASARDIARRRLRLSTNRGRLDGYELQYNLIVAYRALHEAPSPWTLDKASRQLIADSLAQASGDELRRALVGANRNPAFLKPGDDPQAGTARLLRFVRQTFGKEAHQALQTAAETLADAEGGIRHGTSGNMRLRELSAPWRTRAHLRRLELSPRAAEETFSFSVIGDAEPGRFWWSRMLFNWPGVFERQMRRIEAEPSDFTVQLGDMVSRGVRRNYARFLETLSQLNPSKPYLTVIGNHDRHSPHGTSNSLLYRILFGDTDYYFDRGGWRFVVLDSSAQRVRKSQLEWLDKTLDTKLNTIVFTHVPPSPLSAWTDFGGLRGVAGFKKGGERFMEIVSRRGVKRVYLGHVHGFGTETYDGVRYVLTGGGGSPLYPSLPRRNVFHHYLNVQVAPDGTVRETVRRDDGTSFEIR